VTLSEDLARSEGGSTFREKQVELESSWVGSHQSGCPLEPAAAGLSG
jgi:hypothetical protein